MSSSSEPPVGELAPDGGLPAVPDRSGETLAQRYRLLRRLGQGGMGEVYLAKHLLLDKQVAIKILTEGRAVPRAAERLLREARATAGIRHPNIVDITDFGRDDDGEVFIVMEYLQGEDLSDLVYREGRLPWPRVRAICEQVCAALQAAHEQGVIHRDLKPENCFRIEHGGSPDFIKVLDFGIAKLTGPGGQRRRLTNTGAIFGTIEYMAPEQARGKAVDHRIDIYALGVIAYELLTGRVPFDGDEWMEIALKHANDPVAPPSSWLPPAELPPLVDAVVGRALAKDPADRYPTMAAFARALAGVDGGDPTAIGPVPSRPWPLVSAPALGDVPAAMTTAPLEVASDVVAAPRPAVAPAAWITGIVVAAVAAGGVAWWLAARSPRDEDASRTAEASTLEPRRDPERGADEDSTEAASTGDVDATTSRAAADEREADDPAQAADGAGEASPVAVGSDVAPGLTRAQIDATLATAQVKLMACRGTIFGGKAGDRVRVQLTVRGRDGKVVGAKPAGAHAGSKLGGCVAAELRKLSFPPFPRAKQRFSRTVQL